ncbi:hypothetical protein VOLCADRAFT_92724 [Volvox carteri f. nagariensis]|uniref:RING-type domain-containing protein n=1 Tax=Volvox carteri f. nagariensis TaxID=3068 RepID=D8U0D1_VOLCA|nr:uncharacterized protein VOLCADRAFT_92724 [Volvox carteri f. nagariensis]EFJ46841.1 hypothetical protein VOLCADRAFT_92724 [Volvox carteri f. nagariensis]|eukprot:XP_002952050.1 hypothetical protein VOLCADRAFT_92724 [Volvox carteri f. nagariensis]
MLGHAAAATGSKIWIFGGQQGRKFLRTLYCFDTETCTWTRRDTDSMPPARAGHSMVTVHGSVIYMFGGQGKRLYNDLYKLDPITGIFTEVEASGKPPTPRRGHSLVWDGRDYLVCFGGINQSSTDSQLSVFSLSRGAWFTPQAFGPAPSARTQHTAQLLSPGVILIFGGCNSSGTFFNDAIVLDTRTFTWHKPTLLNTAPAPRYHHTCSVVNGRIIIYGGINSKQTFDGVVVLETKFLSDINSVAEELFRMSADATSAASLFNAAAAGGGATTAALPAGLQTSTANSPVNMTGSTGARLSAGPSVLSSQMQSTAQHQHPPVQVVPQPGPASELGFSSSKSLEAVKIQLTDLLLRRNLEEQQLHTAKKAETTESLLIKEREAREAAVKELLQFKLLLAEAESAQASAQQELQGALAKATREAAAAAELRSQLEALQSKLATREEELQEARLLQDGLVKELGIMASRYSRLAVDVQEGAERGGPGGGGGSAGDRGGGSSAGDRVSQQHHAGSSCTRRSSLSSMLAHATHGSGGLAVRGLGGSPSIAREATAVYPVSSLQMGTASSSMVASAGGSVLAGGNSGIVDVLQASGCYSVPLPGHSTASMLSSRQVAPALSSHCTATIRTSASQSAIPQSTTPTACGNCCQQLLALLSEAEVHRASLLDSNQGLNEKVEELTAQNNMLYGQLQQMLAEGGALEPLSVGELEELERKLDSSSRAVRAALTQRKIDEAQRRSSTEQAACAVCMEGPKAVVFNCGHQSCEPCSVKMTTCPFCRVQITARIRLFDA